MFANAGRSRRFCIAVQIKSGESFRTSSGDYFIPAEGHAAIWRSSTVPVFGIVFDPSDKLLRWVDVTAYLRANLTQDRGMIPVSRAAVLDTMALHRDFLAAVLRHAPIDRDNLPAQLLSSDEVTQRGAVWDTWALGRYDARYLILLRRLLLHFGRHATRDTIFILSHATAHPDIFWTPLNWIPEAVEKEVRKTFRWSTEEITWMLKCLDVDEFERASLGFAFDMLLHVDDDAAPKIRRSVSNFLTAGDEERAVRAVSLALCQSRDACAELNAVLTDHPALGDNEFIQAMAEYVRAEGRFSLFEW